LVGEERVSLLFKECGRSVKMVKTMHAKMYLAKKKRVPVSESSADPRVCVWREDGGSVV
jgi:hypothetical protein